MKRKRPDLRVPMAERTYPGVDRPVMVIGKVGYQAPASVPCAECPLALTSISGALGGYRPEQYLEVLHGPADLACHMSPGFPDDPKRQRSCTGVAMYRANVRLVPAGSSAGRAVRVTGQSDLAFASPEAFLRHHKR